LWRDANGVKKRGEEKKERKRGVLEAGKSGGRKNPQFLEGRRGNIGEVAGKKKGKKTSTMVHCRRQGEKRTLRISLATIINQRSKGEKRGKKERGKSEGKKINSLRAKTAPFH